MCWSFLTLGALRQDTTSNQYVIETLKAFQLSGDYHCRQITKDQQNFTRQDSPTQQQSSY